MNNELLAYVSLINHRFDSFFECSERIFESIPDSNYLFLCWPLDVARWRVRATQRIPRPTSCSSQSQHCSSWQRRCFFSYRCCWSVMRGRPWQWRHKNEDFGVMYPFVGCDHGCLYACPREVPVRKQQVSNKKATSSCSKKLKNLARIKCLLLTYKKTFKIM